MTSGGAGPHELRVARVVQETPDARSYVLDVPPKLRERFAYRAGQFLTFQLPWGDGTIARCYSLSSSPDCDDEWVFTVKRVAEGRASNWLHDSLREGDRVRVLAPAGRFVLAEASARPLLLFGGGSGITPLYSIAKTALATSARRIRLVYANRDEASIIFRDALAALAARHAGRFEVVHHLDAESGFLDAEGVRARVAGFADADAYLCGPAPFMELVEAVLRESGVARERIFVERFGSEVPADLEEAEASGAACTVILQLEGAAHAVPCEPGETILQAARRAGLSPPFACEESYCGCCMAKLVRGSVAMAQCHALDASERAEGWILTCQARPTSAACEVRWE